MPLKTTYQQHSTVFGMAQKRWLRIYLADGVCFASLCGGSGACYARRCWEDVGKTSICKARVSFVHVWMERGDHNVVHPTQSLVLGKGSTSQHQQQVEDTESRCLVTSNGEETCVDHAQALTWEVNETCISLVFMIHASHLTVKFKQLFHVPWSKHGLCYMLFCHIGACHHSICMAC